MVCRARKTDALAVVAGLRALAAKHLQPDIILLVRLKISSPFNPDPIMPLPIPPLLLRGRPFVKLSAIDRAIPTARLCLC